MRRLQQVARSGRGGFGGGGGPPVKGIGAGVLGLAVGGAGLLLFQNALFNVDGGHRAIKYRRTSGISKEIYAEGEQSSSQSGALNPMLNTMARNPLRHPLAREPDRLRCPREAEKRRIPHRNERLADGQHHLSCALAAENRCATADLQNAGVRLR